MKSAISTCLWFESDGLAAAEFYTSIIPDSAITGRFPSDAEPPLIVEFVLDGVPYQILNGGPHFKLNEAASIVISTEDQEETDKLWQQLTEGGEESRCGWLKDRFGLSWQLVPKRLIELLNSTDKQAAQRVQEAMMEMHKIDIAALEAAYNENHQ